MRACWIDTSSMFRTVRGFFETVKLSQQRVTSYPASFIQAQQWAKNENKTYA